MMFDMLRRSRFFRLLSWTLIMLHLVWSQMVLAQGHYAESASVGLVSNKTGHATVFREGGFQEVEDLQFKEQLIFGDRVKTGESSMLSMLLENRALISMQEFSEIKISQNKKFLQIVNLVDGRICVATLKNGEPVEVKAPTATVTVQPGSMVSVNVQQDSGQPNTLPNAPTQAALVLTSEEPVNFSLASRAENESSTDKIVTQVQAHEGSASVVSQEIKKVKIDLVEKQAVQVVGHQIGIPYEGPDVPCQIQDIQQIPQHTAIPKKAGESIAENQQRQADQLVKLILPPGKFESGAQSLPRFKNPPILPTDDSNFGEDSSPVSAASGLPLVDVSDTLASFEGPFLVGIPGNETIDGPPVILSVESFSGNISEIDPSDIFNDFPPQVAANLLSSFENPDVPGTVLAGLRVASSPNDSAQVLGGLRLQNSTVNAPVEFASVGVPNSSQQTAVELSGSLLDLQDSQFNTPSTFLSLRNANFDTINTSAPLVVVRGESSILDVGQDFVSTNPSQIEISNRLLHLANGASSQITGAVIDLQASFLDASSANEALIHVENGSSLAVGGDLVRAREGNLSLSRGLLSAINGQIVIEGDAISLEDNSIVRNVAESLMDIQESIVSVSGNVLTIDNSEAQSPGVVQARVGSTLTVGGYVAALQNNGSLTTNDVPVVDLEGSTLMAEGLLRVMNQTVPTTVQLGELVRADAASTVEFSEAVVQVLNTTGLELDLGAVLPFTNNLTGAGVGALLDNSQVTVAGDLVRADGTVVTMPGAGLVQARNGSTLTVGGYVAALQNNGSLTTNGVPVVDLEGSTLTAEGLLQVTNQTVPTTVQLEELVRADAASTVEFSEAVVQVLNTTGLELDLGAVLPFTNNLTGAGVGALLDNSQVTVAGDLVRADGTVVTMPGAGLVQARNGSVLTVGGYVAALQNNGSLTTNGVPVVDLEGSTLMAEGLLRVTNQAVPTTLRLEELVQADAASTVEFSEAVVQVLNTTGLELDLGAVRPFAVNLAETGVVAQLDNSQVMVAGDLVRADGTAVTVPGAGLVQARNGSTLTVGEYVAALQNNGSLTTNDVPVVDLEGSTLTAEGLLKVGPDTILTVDDISQLISVDGTSSVNIQNSLVRIEGNQNNARVTSQANLVTGSGDFLPALNFSPSAKVLQVDDGVVLIEGHVVDLLGGTLSLPGGVLEATNNAQVTVDEYVVSLAGASDFSTGLSPLVRLVDSDLTTGGFLRLTDGQEFNGNGQIGGFATILGTSTLTSTDALIRLEDNSSFTNSLDLIRGQSAAIAVLSLTENAPLLLVDSSSVDIPGDLLEWAGGTLTAPGGLLGVNDSRIANGQEVEISEYIAHIRNGSLINFGSNPLVTLNDAEASVGGLIRLGDSQTFSVQNLNDLLALNGSSQLTTTDAFIRVEEGSVFTSSETLLDGANVDVSKLSLAEAEPLMLVDGSSADLSGIVALETDSLRAPGGILRVNDSPSGTQVSVFDFVVSLNETGTIDLRIDSSPVPFNQSSTPLVHLDAGRLETTGVLRVNNESAASSPEVTINGAIALLSNNGFLDTSGSSADASLVELLNTDLNIISLLRFDHQTDSQTIPTSPWISLTSSTLANQLTVNSLVRVENQSNLTFSGHFTDLLVASESDLPLLNINSLLGVEDSQVTIEGDLVHLTEGNSLNLTNWLLDADNSSTVTVNGKLASISGGGMLESSTTLISISTSQLAVLGLGAAFEISGISGRDGELGGADQAGETGTTGGPGTLRIVNTGDAPTSLLGGFNSTMNFSGSLVNIQGGAGGRGGDAGGPGTFERITDGGVGGNGGEGLFVTGDSSGVRQDIGDVIELFSASVLNINGSNPAIEIFGGTGGNGGTGGFFDTSLGGDGGNGGNGGRAMLDITQGGLILSEDSTVSMNGPLLNIIGGYGGKGGEPGIRFDPDQAGLGGMGGDAVIHSKETLLQIISGSDITLTRAENVFQLRGGFGGDRGSLGLFATQFGESQGGGAIVRIQEGGILEMVDSIFTADGSFMFIRGVRGGAIGDNRDEALELIWDIGGQAELHAPSTLFKISNNSNLDIQRGLQITGGSSGEALANSAPALLTVANGGLLDSVQSSTTIGDNFLSIGNMPVVTLAELSSGASFFVPSDNQLLANGFLIDLSASTFNVGGSILNVSDTIVAGTAEGNGLEGILQAVDESTVNIGVSVVRLGRESRLGSRFIDGKLLDAARPLIKLVNSKMTSGTVFNVSSGSTFTADLQSAFPNDALVSLDASALTINGSLIGVNDSRSAVSVSGHLVSLANGSALTINNGFLVSALSGGAFTLTDGFLVNFASVSNTLNITNVSAPTINPQFPDLPVNLLGSATIGSTNRDNIRVSPNFDPFSVSGNPTQGGGALLEVDSKSTICLGAACSAFPDPEFILE